MIRQQSWSPVTGMVLACLVVASIIISLKSSSVVVDLSALWIGASDNWQHLLLTTILVPRTLMALVCGAALGIAGVLIQQATRNNFASPATLGVNAGALLATVVGMVVVPELMAKAPILVAFAGAMATTLLVLKLSRMISDSPVNLVLVGMAMTLALGSVSAGLMMFWENSLEGLYTWGAGNLAQHNYEGVNRAWPVLAVLMIISWGLGRSLDMVELGETTASGLGINVKVIVNGSLVVALILSSMVVSEVGMISFIGLVAPPLTRFLGFRSTRWLIPAAAVTGALLLLWADIMARWLSGENYSLPAGAMTTLIGAPFMITMLALNRQNNGRLPSSSETGIHSLIKPRPLLVILSLLFITAVVSYFALGGEGFRALLDLRAPRLLVAACAGIILGVAGLLLQTLLKNPLASPDVSGLTTTGVLFAVMGVILIPGLSDTGLIALTLLGSGCALALLLLIGRLTNFQPQFFALTGLCVSALAGTLINIVLVLGSNQSTEVLVWLSGSTYHSSYPSALLLGAGALVLVMISGLLWRKLDIIPLGSHWSGALGVNSVLVMVVLLGGIAVACSLTVSVVGGISFVGLMAPHICRLLGLTSHRHLIPASALMGMALLIGGDYVSRTLMFPFELPAGLVVSCIGGIYFILLLISGRYLRR
ncbi:iron ABC transporter permease [Parendozoicomonas haliclonae]|uniref:Iron(3+)-hydroxamate import system permease protein FhuB n=1 Tax=Parendozoicomonas haliclonae TaxID=1960125 RepID=A0A1X7AS07_9GAMM|nr:iron ABC transporter permease [Parendozoicomonas haliclonae]SMA50922.1 Iron(3+)-hydroxamate import system permease protein FhuB [Parendozoicomonas haliclonae]